MVAVIEKGRYRVFAARTEADVRRAQALRHKAFISGAMGQSDAGGYDSDPFDAQSMHFLVESVASQQVAGCFRLMELARGADVETSYSAQFYDLSALHAYELPLIELGRFCIDPHCRDPDVIRIAWAAITRFVDQHGIGMMFGCSSFRGTDMTPYVDAFALLGSRHLAPKAWRPRLKAPLTIAYGETLRDHLPDLKKARLTIPTLLRTYLLMGGWVSDHAVIDRQLNTLHVFTGVEIRSIPDMRKRLLRADAEQLARGGIDGAGGAV